MLRDPETGSAELPLAVVVPTHETRELTLRCLASLEGGSGRPEELVVVDDGSTDGTAEAIAARHPRVRVLRNERALGFTGAANRGLAETRAPLLLLLNSDTEAAPDCLTRFVETFRERDELGVAGAALCNADGTPQWSGGPTPTALWLFAASSGLGRLRSILAPRRPGSQEPREVDWVAGAALAMRREVWESHGPLDERFALYCQDLDFCLRAGNAGWQIRVLPDCRVLHHHGATIAGIAGDRQDLEKLWTDLVLWAGKEGGEQAARGAARVLRAGGLVRAVAVAVAGAFATGPRRRRLRRRLAAVRQARRALVAPTRPGPGAGGQGPGATGWGPGARGQGPGATGLGSGQLPHDRE